MQVEKLFDWIPSTYMLKSHALPYHFFSKLVSMGLQKNSLMPINITERVETKKQLLTH